MKWIFSPYTNEYLLCFVSVEQHLMNLSFQRNSVFAGLLYLYYSIQKTKAIKETMIFFKLFLMLGSINQVRHSTEMESELSNQSSLIFSKLKHICPKSSGLSAMSHRCLLSINVLLQFMGNCGYKCVLNAEIPSSASSCLK